MKNKMDERVERQKDERPYAELSKDLAALARKYHIGGFIFQFSIDIQSEPGCWNARRSVDMAKSPFNEFLEVRQVTTQESSVPLIEVNP